MADDKQLNGDKSEFFSKELTQEVTGVFSKVLREMQGEGVDKKTLEGAMKDSVSFVLKELDAKDGKKDDVIHRDTVVEAMKKIKENRDEMIPDDARFNANYSKLLEQVKSSPETIKTSELIEKLDGEFGKQLGVMFEALDNNPKDGKLTTGELLDAMIKDSKAGSPDSEKRKYNPRNEAILVAPPSTPQQVVKAGKGGGITS